jgi:hypothetical protein
MIMLHFSWNEWLTLPVQFNDLPRTAQLALTIYDCTGPNKLWPVGGTTISLFSKHGLFRQVNFKNIVKKRNNNMHCRVWWIYVCFPTVRQMAVILQQPQAKLKIMERNKCRDSLN